MTFSFSFESAWGEGWGVALYLASYVASYIHTWVHVHKGFQLYQSDPPSFSPIFSIATSNPSACFSCVFIFFRVVAPQVVFFYPRLHLRHPINECVCPQNFHGVAAPQVEFCLDIFASFRLSSLFVHISPFIFQFFSSCGDLRK